MRRELEKKFSLGLVMDTSMTEFNAFLKQYHPYIENFYFSLPLGDRFHSRKRVAEQFRSAFKTDQFWAQLKAIQTMGIKLEVLFNTHGLNREDVEAGRQMLDAHGIDPEKVGLVNDAYDAAKEFFPDKELVYSFNNSPASIGDYAASKHQYAEYVIGRQFIRNESLLDYIHQELQGKTVLLVNNGCSHICGGCSNMSHCIDSYRRARHEHSAEYLYALQSIMPFELHEGWIDLSKVDLIKINSRNTDIHYLRRSLQSYIEGDEDKWIAESKENYSLWAHLTWHMKHYSAFDLDRIRKIKKCLYRGVPIEEQATPEFVSVWGDLSDRYIFRHSARSLPSEGIRRNINRFLKTVDGQLTGWCVGVQACQELLKQVDTVKLIALITTLRKEGQPVYFSLPPLTEAKHPILMNLLQNLAESIPDGIIVNDWNTFSMLQEKGIFVLRGAELDMRQAPVNSMNTPCVRDMLDSGVPSGMRGRECIVRYPLVQLCRGICSRRTSSEGNCDEKDRQYCIGHKPQCTMQNLHDLTQVGDVLMYRRVPNDKLYLSAISSEVTLLYTPDAEWTEAMP